MSVIYMLHLVIDILRFLCKFSSNFIDAFSLKKFKRKLTYKNAYKRAVFTQTCSTIHVLRVVYFLNAPIKYIRTCNILNSNVLVL